MMQKATIPTRFSFWKNFPTFSKLRAKEKRKAEIMHSPSIHQLQYSKNEPPAPDGKGIS